MKAAIFNPYLDTLGGGERYTISFAKQLAKINYTVDIQWADPSLAKKIEERFGIKVADLNFIDDIKRGDGYDICFWVSDGSIPTLKARKNYIHFQVPFTDVDGRSLLNKMKLFRVNKVICNSEFTKKIIDKEYGVNSVVLYPPVPVEEIKPAKKQKIILSVGRFSQLEQAKRQDILISAFKNIINTSSDFNDWKLILVGGADVGAEEYIKKLKKLAKGYPIDIIKSPSFDNIKKMYSKADIFWTASGLGVDESKFPRKVEHFGMALVEAMSAGSLVFAFNAGGHKEIINNNKNGFLWDKESELVNKTKEIISNSNKFKAIRVCAIETSKLYSIKNFESTLAKII